jgi:large conductance mechanosensitive channel
MAFFEEFKKFVQQGNVLDLAVGVIIGGAFGKIVASLVADVVTPVLGLVLGGVSFTSLQIVLGTKPDSPILKYGNFLQAILDFLVVAFVIFLFIRTLNKLKKKEEPAAPAAPPEPSRQEQLLQEIRDLLRQQR